MDLKKVSSKSWFWATICNINDLYGGPRIHGVATCMDLELILFINRSLNCVSDPNLFINWDLKQVSNLIFHRSKPLDNQRIRYPFYIPSGSALWGPSIGNSNLREKILCSPVIIPINLSLKEVGLTIKLSIWLILWLAQSFMCHPLAECENLVRTAPLTTGRSALSIGFKRWVSVNQHRKYSNPDPGLMS